MNRDVLLSQSIVESSMGVVGRGGEGKEMTELLQANPLFLMASEVGQEKEKEHSHIPEAARLTTASMFFYFGYKFAQAEAQAIEIERLAALSEPADKARTNVATA